MKRDRPGDWLPASLNFVLYNVSSQLDGNFAFFGRDIRQWMLSLVCMYTLPDGPFVGSGHFYHINSFLQLSNYYPLNIDRYFGGGIFQNYINASFKNQNFTC